MNCVRTGDTVTYLGAVRWHLSHQVLGGRAGRAQPRPLRAEARENVLDALRLMLSPEPESATDPAGSEPLELSVLSEGRDSERHLRAPGCVLIDEGRSRGTAPSVSRKARPSPCRPPGLAQYRCQIMVCVPRSHRNRVYGRTSESTLLQVHL